MDPRMRSDGNGNRSQRRSAPWRIPCKAWFPNCVAREKAVPRVLLGSLRPSGRAQLAGFLRFRCRTRVPARRRGSVRGALPRCFPWHSRSQAEVIALIGFLRRFLPSPHLILEGKRRAPHEDQGPDESSLAMTWILGTFLSSLLPRVGRATAAPVAPLAPLFALWPPFRRPDHGFGSAQLFCAPGPLPAVRHALGRGAYFSRGRTRPRPTARSLRGSDRAGRLGETTTTAWSLAAESQLLAPRSRR